mmetsp:Transcript_1893/g.5530  ORF Transcript_1893/g.5530 Transcript_1893/m.5530 type:complete len:764 (+) Transcript_1893:77-2368(+)|eukprot:CAMPEP_0206136250 /NCGR_PEP_ID=MMETSP1473-20131121/1486_1 /ASSEMBLY_ACC=CAM_ASM_001109 /TAXON_ID=1461547 /ORGANISM="Stichococcus sp, Strain RCC1054" /LENGTH=763 /DNA_ID=CAMNT_0053528651 /DNA_START=52 /DNA_END=2343 /DNA_ORIENTATION=+
MPDRGRAGDLKPPGEDLLSAIVLADSFNQRFRPMTAERPKVLLPLVNVPLINYTLEWLTAAGVDEILVFCCAHAAQVQEHLEAGPWLKPGARCKVHIVTITTCSSAGEALRAIDQKHLIKNDFVLVTGDTVANMDLAAAVKAHRSRREKDKNAILTMVMRPATSPLHRARLGKDELAVVINPATGQLLKYEDLSVPAAGKGRRSHLAVDAHLFGEHDVLSARTDLLDCQVYIAAVDVLMLFSDNFDYQNVRREFVTGVLSEEELGNKIYVHVLGPAEYAERVANLRAYDAVSRDVLGRWAFPFAPDTNVLPAPPPPTAPWATGSTYAYSRRNVYMEHDVAISVPRSARIGHDSCIGAGTSIADNVQMEASVIGRECDIGRGAVIRDSYIGSGVTVHENAVLCGALVLEGAVIHEDARLLPGSIICYKCVVGPGHTVVAQERISLVPQPETQASMSDDDTEAPASPAFSPSSGEYEAEASSSKPSSRDLKYAEALAVGRKIDGPNPFSAAAAGRGGAGYRWAPPADHLRFSIAAGDYSPPAPDDASSDAGSTTTTVDLDQMDVAAVDADFPREVLETFLRCKRDGFSQANAVIELNGVKIAEDRTFAEVARYVFTTILGLCLPPAARVRAEYRSLFPTSAPDVSSKGGREALLKAFLAQLEEWRDMLQKFLKGDDDQVEMILTFEEFCGEDGEFAGDNGKSFASIFAQVLKQLYDHDVLVEDALLAWADEKAEASAEDKVFLQKAAPFIEWLRTAESSEEEESD